MYLRNRALTFSRNLNTYNPALNSNVTVCQVTKLCTSDEDNDIRISYGFVVYACQHLNPSAAKYSVFEPDGLNDALVKSRTKVCGK